MRVGRRYRFRASHHVEGLPEPWGSNHWHDYTVEIVFEGDPKNGLLVDHEELDGLWRPWAGKMDGRDLNRLFPLTTVEALAQTLKDAFGADEVTVWEDDDRWATAR
jgi:6-pyruvoyl-tetrahydropterin synthase